MNIRDLTYIRAVARLGHFGRAAEACHVSQPALSSQIKKLETELGVTLFERDNRSVRVTSIGKDILALADETLNLVDRIYSTANAARDPLSGQFRLGSIPTISPYLMPGFVKSSRSNLPQLRLLFQEDITERLNASLLAGDLDAAILATLPDTSKLDVIPLYDEPFWVMFPSRHALKLLSHIKTQDLPVDELLLLTEGHCFRDQAVDVCQLGAAPERREIQANSMETLINMVAAEQGITLLPAMALAGQKTGINSTIQTEPLNDPEAYRRIYLTFRKSTPRRVLLGKISEIIRADLPESVRLID